METIFPKKRKNWDKDIINFVNKISKHILNNTTLFFFLVSNYNTFFFNAGLIKCSQNNQAEIQYDLVCLSVVYLEIKEHCIVPWTLYILCLVECFNDIFYLLKSHTWVVVIYDIVKKIDILTYNYQSKRWRTLTSVIKFESESSDVNIQDNKIE